MKKVSIQAAIIAAAVSFFCCFAEASEDIYYSGTTWKVSLIDEYATSGQFPVCSVKTNLWTSKSISLEATLYAVDDVRFALRISKNGWDLPVGQSTTVTVGGWKIQSKAVSENQLYSDFMSEGMRADTFQAEVFLRSVFDKKRPSFFDIEFQGGEPTWRVSAVSRFDAEQIVSAYQYCTLSLIELGPSIFPEDTGPSGTSPFSTKQGSRGITHQDKDAGAEEANMIGTEDAKIGETQSGEGLLEWKFSLREEYFGKVCYVEFKNDGATVGFSASSTGDVEAFIASANPISTRVKWRIDGNIAYSFDAKISGYSRRPIFEIPKLNFIREIIEGETLSVEINNGKTYSLDISTAHGVFDQFLLCRAQNTSVSNITGQTEADE